MVREKIRLGSQWILLFFLALLLVAVAIALAQGLGVDWILFFGASASVFVAFVMVYAVYVAVAQLRASSESSERFVGKLVEVSEKIGESNEKLSGVGEAILLLVDLMAREAGKIPVLNADFDEDIERLKMSQGVKSIRLRLRNEGTMTCRNPMFDLYFSKGIEVRKGKGYRNLIGKYSNREGIHVAKFSRGSLSPGYTLYVKIEVFVPDNVFGEKEIECCLMGDNCERVDKNLVLDIIV